MSNIEIFVMLIYGLFYYIVGAVLGSFLLVVVRRSHRKENWTNTRSVCESCGKVLNWYEMIPTISYLVLQGKCSKCKAKIDPSHFICETGLGLIYLGIGLTAYLNNLESLTIINIILTTTVLWKQTVSDFLYHEVTVIDNYVVALIVALITGKIIPVVIWIIIVNIINRQDNWKYLGAGDLDIVILIYASLGRALDLVSVALISSVTALIAYIIKYRHTESKQIPYVPFLTIGYALVLAGMRFV